MKLIPELIQDRIENKPHAARFFYYIAHILELPFYNKNSRGAPPYDRPTLVALILYSLFEGYFSAKSIHHFAQDNLGAIWILGNMNLPSSKTIERVLEDILFNVETVFKQVAEICMAVGLVGNKRMYIDGRKTKANASKHKAMSYQFLCEKIEAESNKIDELMTEIMIIMGSVEHLNDQDLQELIVTEAKEIYENNVREHRLKLKHKNRLLFSDKEDLPLGDIKDQNNHDQKEEKGDVLDQIEPPLQGVAEKTMDAIGFKSLRLENMEAGKKYLEESWQKENGAQPVPPNKQVNFTDPESRIMVTKHNGVQQCYNNFVLVDDKAHIIVGAYTVNSSSDKQAFIPTVLHAENIIDLAGATIGADAGFFSAENIEFAQEKGIDFYVSCPKMSSPFGKDKFIYIKEDDVYVCPENNRLTPGNKISENAKTVSYSTQACKECPSQSECTRAQDGIRRIRRDLKEDELREQAREKASSPAGREILRMRKSVPEPVWGNMTYQDGLDQLHYRGLNKTDKEFKLRSIMHSLRKVFQKFVHSRKTRQLITGGLKAPSHVA